MIARSSRRSATFTHIPSLRSAKLRADSPGKQGLVIYIFGPGARYEVKNDKTITRPLHRRRFRVKRMASLPRRSTTSFWNDSETFLLEFAWPARLGQPCATEPLLIITLLSMGAEDSTRRTLADASESAQLTKEEKKRKGVAARAHAKERRERDKHCRRAETVLAARSSRRNKSCYASALPL